MKDPADIKFPSLKEWAKQYWDKQLAMKRAEDHRVSIHK